MIIMILNQGSSMIHRHDYHDLEKLVRGRLIARREKGGAAPALIAPVVNTPPTPRQFCDVMLYNSLHNILLYATPLPILYCVLRFECK